MNELQGFPSFVISYSCFVVFHFKEKRKTNFLLLSLGQKYKFEQQNKRYNC